MPLTDEEKAAIRVRITKLTKQYDALMSGTAISEFVDQNGERVKYTTANAAKLLALINSLEAMLNPTFARAYRARPVGFIFR